MLLLHEGTLHLESGELGCLLGSRAEVVIRPALAGRILGVMPTSSLPSGAALCLLMTSMAAGRSDEASKNCVGGRG